MPRTRTMLAWYAMLAVLLAPAMWSEAAPSVSFNVSDAGSGLFDYTLFVDNAGGPDPIIGLLVLHGSSVFGLSGASVIGAPAGWAFLPPDPGPPLVDSLDYFSLDPAADIAIDGILGGFSFRSPTPPSTLSGTDFAVEAVVLTVDAEGNPAAVQRSLGIAHVPEPATLALVAAAMLGLGAVRRLLHEARPSALGGRRRGRRPRGGTEVALPLHAVDG